MMGSRSLYAAEVPGLHRGGPNAIARAGLGSQAAGMGPSSRPSGLGGPVAGLQARAGPLGLRDHSDRYSHLGRASLLSGAPAPPPLPSHHGGLPGSHSLSGNASACSRSVPAGRRERPTTPSGPSQYHPSRRAVAPDDPRSAAASALGQGAGAFDAGREVPMPVRMGDANARSKSVAGGNSGPSRHGGVGMQHREGLNSGGSATSSSSTCDKCDGKHSSDRCPHFHKDREKHKDAWVNYGRKGGPLSMGAPPGNFVLRSARVMRQPGDGSCLFHSLLHGLRSNGESGTAASLRRELAGFLQQNPSLQIAGDTLEEWVRWDSNASVNEYARRMSVSGWGGGIEMACCSLLKGVNIHVYENLNRGHSSEFKRISCFDCPNAAKTIHVLYQGGVHYDALQPLTA
eukprot:TRINITY_DN59600_c0_g1_i1.p1 TRINITY_DN59600_c0_g1~~TRINITY_DN59600_c0_g1_i1.p1  ORF type:complete len:401 (-),score=48.03 TRINITY_DN59600_c0_g1_i1:11-1213(-)